MSLSLCQIRIFLTLFEIDFTILSSIYLYSLIIQHYINLLSTYLIKSLESISPFPTNIQETNFIKYFVISNDD